MRKTRMFLGAVVATLALAVLQVPPPVAARAAAMPNDFNGDGYADLAIGVQGEDIGRRDNAGAVNVLYGSRRGLTAAGDQFWSQDTPGVKGHSHDGNDWSGDDFGSALASGDFNRDGYADLAIGVRGARAGRARVRAGAVNVLYGSRSGLTAAGDQRWSQANLPGAPEKGDGFGSALAAGDFDDDGYGDLAIGVPYEDSAGRVQILYGGPGGLSSTETAVLTRASAGPPTPGLWGFGRALVAGDLNGDGLDDLAVGAPTDSAGEAAVFFGSVDGLSGAGSQVWSQASPGIDDEVLTGDRFGAALAIGDFDADGFGDLAIGTPNIEIDQAVGKVVILPGTAGGPSAAGRQIWPSPVAGNDDWGPEFGFALATGDFDGNGADDLAIGAPWTGNRVGSVLVLYGAGAVGLASGGSQLWSQDSAGVPGTSEWDDVFGISVAALDVNANGKDDLAIGASGESSSKDQVGRVTVLYGRAAGISSRGARSWTQDSPGVKDRAEAWDRFGSTLVGSPGRAGW